MFVYKNTKMTQKQNVNNFNHCFYQHKLIKLTQTISCNPRKTRNEPMKWKDVFDHQPRSNEEIDWIGLDTWTWYVFSSSMTTSTKCCCFIQRLSDGLPLTHLYMVLTHGDYLIRNAFIMFTLLIWSYD